MKVLLACERSGGHVFPALGLADKIKESSPKDQIYFFITSKSLQKYVRDDKYLVFGRCFNKRRVIIEGFWRFFESIYLLIKINPDKVVGFGGRDSFFLLFFAALTRKNTAIYELNSSFGRANKVLSLFVGKVFSAFDSLRARNVEVVGLVLRKNLIKIDRKTALGDLNLKDKPIILCFGGSQGAGFINRIFMKLVKEISLDCQIIHLTGKRDYLEIKEFYNTIKNSSVVMDFCPTMERLYSVADIVISRAGASTLAEIAHYAIAPILIGHPTGSGHQDQNALYFKEKNAAFVFKEKDFLFSNFKAAVERLLNDEALRKRMSDNLKSVSLGVSFEQFCKNSNF
ncbi:MAG: UDP-N-acetylglucosamine--N-acetylmuramyl-(pentapeptide) pyrophosphoryl-undecaprenol N-acetylglucosamine transferase [Candidatus Omnitrophica bacterium]|nr:UDP-N-acetylglucosamine--N-acetylmuramyl-(pentapeptide) pyrophosphoryl-undecaprenol N-acetylglucosamine transferase [Candidatus Omnitrophota bacterium]